MLERKLPTVVLLCVVALAGASAPAAAQPGAAVHVPVPAGWTAVDQEYRYERDTLWEYINGAAELFLTYGFRELIVLDVEMGDAALSLSVYDMGRPLDAYGVFEAEKPGEAQVLAGVGAAALLQPPYRGLLLKDRFYVKVEAGAGDISDAALAAAMKDIAAGLPGSDELPPQLSALPATGRVPGSIAFAGANLLGLSDLSNCLYADYESETGAGYRLFVMKPSPEFLANASGRWTRSEDEGATVFTRRIPYSGVVVLRGDAERLVGVSGFEETDAALAVLRAAHE